MKTLLRPWFITACSTWLTIYLFRQTGNPLPIVNNWLNDLLAVPVIANLALAFQRRFIIRSEKYCFKPGHIIFIVLYVSLVFEVLLPRMDVRYTADWVDVLMYVVGGMAFYWWGNKQRHPELVEG